VIATVLKTQGAFTYSELKRMPLDEYFRLQEELMILNTEENRTLSIDQQKQQAMNDPFIRKRL